MKDKAAEEGGERVKAGYADHALPKVAAVLSGIVLFAALASYLMTRASNRSAFWNMGAGSVAVLLTAVLLLILTLVLVRVAFR